MKERVFLIICCLVITVHYSEQTSCTAQTGNNSTEVIHNNTIISKPSLGTALEYVISHPTEEEPMTICLSNGLFSISEKYNFNVTGLSLIGTGKSVIRCVFDSSDNDTRNSIFINDSTMFFQDSKIVTLEGIEFIGCPYPFRAINIHNLTVNNCTFREFKEAVFDIFNCERVQLVHLLFDSNKADRIFFEKFRGNTGTVAIGYREYPLELSDPNVTISHCKFTNNRVETDADDFISAESVLSNTVFPGRGGGLGILINESRANVTIKANDCDFIRNYAEVYGGAIFIVINGYDVQHNISFDRVNVIGNRADYGAAGAFVSFLSATANYTPPHSVLFTDCLFEDNVGIAGGAMYVLTSYIGALGMYFKLERCQFINNKGPDSADEYGAALAVSLYHIFRQRMTAQRHDIIDCTFSGNKGRNGIISTGYSPLRFSGTNKFFNNTGSSLRIVGSLIALRGTLLFYNNSGLTEGALSFQSFGQLRMNTGLEMEFKGNAGRIGSSITVINSDPLAAFSSVLYNPSCFATVADPLLAPEDWSNISVKFEDNVAVLGSAVYISRINHCAWFSQRSPYFDMNFIKEWPIWDFRNNTNTGYPDQQNFSHYFGTEAYRININSPKIEAWPSEKFLLSINGIDQFNEVTAVNGRFLQEAEGENRSITLDPEIVVVAGSSENGLLTDQFSMEYSAKSPSDVSDDLNYTVNVQDTFQSIGLFPFASNLSIEAEVCPGGYVLQAVSGGGFTCICIDMREIVDCETGQDSVIIKDGLWAGYVEQMDSSLNLFFYTCPAGYCECTLNSSLGPRICVYKYTHSTPNDQCIDKREGLLCGSCKNGDGYSVLLNNCVSCSNGFIALLFVLIIWDIIWFVGLTLLDKALPEWLYPFIFYIQIAPIASEYFPDTFTIVGVYMTYIKSSIGFYFWYDFCLLNHLPLLASYALRYIPFIVAVMVCTTIWIIRKYILKRKSLQNHGYWIITLLLYPGLVKTSISLLNCPQISDRNGITEARWFYDANMLCADGWHVPLAMFSVVIIFLCLLTNALVVLITVKKPERVRKYTAPLTSPYKKETEWWSGIELARRTILIVIFTAFPINTVYAIVLLVLILFVYSFILPYKSLLANAMEIILLINLTILMMFDATPLIRESLFLFYDGETISRITWFLSAFYYLPLLLLIATAFGLLVKELKVFRDKGKALYRERLSLSRASELQQRRFTQVTTHTVDFGNAIDASDMDPLEQAIS